MEFIANNIEQIENIFGLLVLFVATIIVLLRRTWPNDEVSLFARGFFGIGLLADLYWSVFTAVFGFTPPNFYVSEMGWLAQELFLLLLVIEVYRAEGQRGIRPLSWIGPIIVGALTIWFIVATGSPVTNSLMGATMAGLSSVAISGLLAARENPGKMNKCLYCSALLFIIVEHAIWSCSVLDASVSITNPYYWFDPLLPFTIIAILACVLRLKLPDEGSVG